MFPTNNQLSKFIRVGKKRYLKAPAFDGAPFKKGIVIELHKCLRVNLILHEEHLQKLELLV